MNIAERIRTVSGKLPEKKSVVLGADGSSYTFKEFEERSNQFAHKLKSLGIKEGTRTLLFVKPCLDFSVITFALFKVGAVPVLIDPGMGLKNLLKSIADVKPEAMVSIGLVHWLRRLRPVPFRNIKVKVALSNVGGNTHNIYKNLESFPKTFDLFPAAPKDLAAILFTSGGTGKPKGVLYTHEILNAQTDALRDMFSLNESKIDLPGFPLFALFTLAMGMTSVIPELDPTKPAKCDPKKIVGNIQKYQATFVAGSPSIWERVGRYCLENKIILSSIEHVVMFGAPVRAEIHEMFKKILVNGDTYTPYGATECLPVSLVSGSEVLGQHLKKMNEGNGTCIGKAVPRVELKIIEISDIPETQIKELPTGHIGEILVQGTQVTPGYFGNEKETEKAKILVNGKLWHRMGDVGHLDENGNLWFLGRKAHRVDSIYGQMYSIRVEAIFNQHPEVRRTSLVKLEVDGKIVPGLVVERKDRGTEMSESFLKELRFLGKSSEYTAQITHFFLHKSFPVDVRHNIKIDRAALSNWAQSLVKNQN